MGKLFFAVVVAVAIIVGIIAIANQPKQSPQNQFLNPFAQPTASATQSAEVKQIPPTEVPVTLGPAEPVPATMSAVIKTSKGDITVTLFRKDAPLTVLNFINKANTNFYNGLTFHRVEDWVIQGGDPNGDGTGGNDMKNEATSPHSFVTGSLGMAGHNGPNGTVISNDSQFFIVKKDATWLDGQYTNFGIVTSGMDVVNNIAIGDKILGITIEKSTTP